MIDLILNGKSDKIPLFYDNPLVGPLRPKLRMSRNEPFALLIFSMTFFQLSSIVFSSILDNSILDNPILDNYNL